MCKFGRIANKGRLVARTLTEYINNQAYEAMSIHGYYTNDSENAVQYVVAKKEENDRKLCLFINCDLTNGLLSASVTCVDLVFPLSRTLIIPFFWGDII